VVESKHLSITTWLEKNPMYIDKRY